MLNASLGTNIFRSPRDLSDQLREESAAQGSPPYGFSYTFNGTGRASAWRPILSGQTATPPPPTSSWPPSCACRQNHAGRRTGHRRRAASRQHPDRIGGWPLAPKAPSGGAWNGKTVALRHSKNTGNVNFSDGHAQPIPWQWTSNIFYFRPNQQLSVVCE